MADQEAKVSEDLYKNFVEFIRKVNELNDLINRYIDNGQALEELDKHNAVVLITRINELREQIGNQTNLLIKSKNFDDALGKAGSVIKQSQTLIDGNVTGLEPMKFLETEQQEEELLAEVKAMVHPLKTDNPGSSDIDDLLKALAASAKAADEATEGVGIDSEINFTDISVGVSTINNYIKDCIKANKELAEIRETVKKLEGQIGTLQQEKNASDASIQTAESEKREIEDNLTLQLAQMKDEKDKAVAAALQAAENDGRLTQALQAAQHKHKIALDELKATLETQTATAAAAAAAQARSEEELLVAVAENVAAKAAAAAAAAAHEEALAGAEGKLTALAQEKAALLKEKADLSQETEERLAAAEANHQAAMATAVKKSTDQINAVERARDAERSTNDLLTQQIKAVAIKEGMGDLKAKLDKSTDTASKLNVVIDELTKKTSEINRLNTENVAISSKLQEAEGQLNVSKAAANEKVNAKDKFLKNLGSVIEAMSKSFESSGKQGNSGGSRRSRKRSVKRSRKRSVKRSRKRSVKRTRKRSVKRTRKRTRRNRR